MSLVQMWDRNGVLIELDWNLPSGRFILAAGDAPFLSSWMSIAMQRHNLWRTKWYGY